MSYRTIRYEVADRILTLTLNRPDALNAYSSLMGDEIIAALDQADADDDIRTIIFTGSGDRAFCAGLDLSEGAGVFDMDGDVVNGVNRDIGGKLTLRLFRCFKPVIAAVNGAAVGIGATMQLAMDIRFAADTARFGFVFARRGITPEAASSWFLPRLVGIQTALDWCYSGRLVSAEEAHRSGLVLDVVPAADLLSHARKYALAIVSNSAPVSIALTRQMMWRLHSAPHPMDAHRIDSRAVQYTAAIDDAGEGVAAFRERRDANWTGSVATDMPDWFPWWDEPNFS